MTQRGAAPVPQLDPLQVIPDALVRIQMRRPAGLRRVERWTQRPYDALLGTFRQAGIAAEEQADIRLAIWEKFAAISGAAVMVMTRLPAGPLLACPETHARSCMTPWRRRSQWVAPQIDTFLNRKLEEGLSTRTVEYIHAVLRSARQAVEKHPFWTPVAIPVKWLLRIVLSHLELDRACQVEMRCQTQSATAVVWRNQLPTQLGGPGRPHRMPELRALKANDLEVAVRWNIIHARLGVGLPMTERLANTCKRR